MRLPNQALATHSGLRALCRPGDRQHRRRHRGRRAESERHSDLRGDAVGAALRVDDPFFGSVGWQRRYGNPEMSQFRSAEMIADRWRPSREHREEFAVASREKALAAQQAGRFDRGRSQPRATRSARRDPGFQTGTRSARCLSGRGWSAARGTAQPDLRRLGGTLIVYERGLKAHGLAPRTRMHHLPVRGADPVWMTWCGFSPLRFPRRLTPWPRPDEHGPGRAGGDHDWATTRVICCGKHVILAISRMQPNDRVPDAAVTGAVARAHEAASMAPRSGSRRFSS